MKNIVKETDNAKRTVKEGRVKSGRETCEADSKSARPQQGGHTHLQVINGTDVHVINLVFREVVWGSPGSLVFTLMWEKTACDVQAVEDTEIRIDAI